jgi:hypothetical protein
MGINYLYRSNPKFSVAVACPFFVPRRRGLFGVCPWTVSRLLPLLSGKLFVLKAAYTEQGSVTHFVVEFPPKPRKQTRNREEYKAKVGLCSQIGSGTECPPFKFPDLQATIHPDLLRKPGTSLCSHSISPNSNILRAMKPYRHLLLLAAVVLNATATDNQDTTEAPGVNVSLEDLDSCEVTLKDGNMASTEGYVMETDQSKSLIRGQNGRRNHSTLRPI